MKKLFPLFVIGIVFVSCGEPENKTSSFVDSAIQQFANKNKVYVDSIVHNSDSIDVADSIYTYEKETDDTIENINGKVYYNLPYCGGMRPTQERLDELAKWNLLTNATLVLKNNFESYEINISSKGEFSKQMPEGDYKVYLKKVNKEIWNINQEGCNNCLTEPITAVKLSVKGKNEIRFTFRCPPGLRE